ncbi:hypothetical protein CC80DRAFT_11530 [Byssothecium circinans]|uniref:Uncharacterized protein n=1 Tax=Byssothecium circinans TaxID=147558 RepID=A0A6A5UFJ2_9PLEO|nr:hypothetical protein CC80DRAFT_11530 [Byssothecium circinans]
MCSCLRRRLLGSAHLASARGDIARLTSLSPRTLPARNLKKCGEYFQGGGFKGEYCRVWLIPRRLLSKTYLLPCLLILSPLQFTYCHENNDRRWRVPMASIRSRHIMGYDLTFLVLIATQAGSQPGHCTGFLPSRHWPIAAPFLNSPKS